MRAIEITTAQGSPVIAEGLAADLIFQACRKFGEANCNRVSGLPGGYYADFEKRGEEFRVYLVGPDADGVAAALVDKFDF